jgi:hypothetical protein
MQTNKTKIDLFAIINWLNKHENWVNTSNEVNAQAIKAINTINKIDTEKPVFETFEEFAFLVETAAYLRFDVFMRMFNELGIKQQGFGGDALMFCYDNLKEEGNNSIRSEMSVILQRVALLIQAELVYKIFGEENRKRVINAINELKEKGELPND